MQACANLGLLAGFIAVVFCQRSLKGDGTIHGAPCRGKGNHEAVADGINLVAAVLLYVRAYKSEMLAQKKKSCPFSVLSENDSFVQLPFEYPRSISFSPG